MAELPLNQVICNDNLKVLRTLPDNSIDALITDPPAGISFMNLAFDSKRGGREQWIAWLKEILEECKRVMKPGAIGFVWSLPRTQHWTALACEDAGFDIWDNLGVAVVTGSGMPKGTDIGKLLKKREDKETQKWDGWKTPSLKPAMEMWVAIRKPFSGSCVDNVLEWGTGAINIGDCRVGLTKRVPSTFSNQKTKYCLNGGWGIETHDMNLDGKNENIGRYPANYIQVHSPNCSSDKCDPECPCRILGEQGNIRLDADKRRDYDVGTVAGYFHQFAPPFTYQPRAKWNNRNDGTKHLLWKRDKTSSIGWVSCSPEEWEEVPERDRVAGNIHATVKSTQLMEFFVKLATPPGGVVLDPFAGSGSTAVACVRCGFDFIAIEQEPEYCRIAEARIDNATPFKVETKQPTLEERVAWLETQQQATSAKLRRIEKSGGIQLSLF